LRDSFPEAEGYEIHSYVSRGAAGEVWRGVQEGTLRDAAVKFLAPLHARGLAPYRFAREVEIAASLEHENLVRVFGCGRGRDGPWLAMEFVDGPSLDAWLEQERPSLRDRLEVFRRICAGVRHAHQAGVIHRDLKPRNILITPQGVPKVLDFGLASRPDLSMHDVTLTREGEVFGTLAWMPPEQAAGEWKRVDALSDVHALGAILFFLVAGEPVMPPGMPAEAQWAAARSGSRPSLRQRVPWAPRDLAAIVDKCLQPEKAHRYPGVAALEADVQHWLSGEPVVARKGATLYWLGKKMRKHWRPAAGTAALLMLGAGLLWERARLREERAATAQKEADLSRQMLHEGQEMMSQFLVEARQQFASLGHPEWADAWTDRVKAFRWSIGSAESAFDPRRSLGRAALARGDDARQRGDYAAAAKAYGQAITQLKHLVSDAPEATVFREELGAARIGMAVAQNRLKNHRGCAESAHWAVSTLLPGGSGQLSPASCASLVKAIDVMIESVLRGSADAAAGVADIGKILAAAPWAQAGGPSHPEEFIALSEFQSSRAHLLIHLGRHAEAAQEVASAIACARQAGGESGTEEMAKRAFARGHLAAAALAKARQQTAAEQESLTAASELLVSETTIIPKNDGVRLHQQLMDASADLGERLAQSNELPQAIAATRQAIRCGDMITRSQSSKYASMHQWSLLLLRIAAREQLSGNAEAAREDALNALQRFRKIRESGSSRYAGNQLGVCEAAVFLAEIRARPEDGKPPWHEVAERELAALHSSSRPLSAAHYGVYAQLRNRLDTLSALAADSPGNTSARRGTGK
jgi:tetratricopeptide (TPR) repeat protein